MRTRFTANPGQSLSAIGLVTGFARGLEVDNPSGSWLYIPQVETSIPPYTLGWAFGFAYDVSSFDIIAQALGPAGQVSTTAGDPIVVYVTDYRIPDAVGSSPPGFIQQFTPVLNAFLFNLTVSVITGAGGTLIAGVVGKRIRLLSIDLFINRSSNAGGACNDDTITCIMQDSSNASNVSLLAAGGRNGGKDNREWPNGIDITTGANLTYAMQTAFQSMGCRISASYELI